MKNALESAKKLIAGRVGYDELCRHAAHNLAERKEIGAMLGKDNSLPKRKRMSEQRKNHLLRQLKSLKIEAGLLRTKERRIRPHVLSEHQFII